MQKKRRSKLKRFFRFIREVREAVSLAGSVNYRFIRFASPGHFYSPIPDYDTIRERSQTRFDKADKDIPGIELNAEAQLKLVSDFRQFINEVPFKHDQETDSSCRYYFNNPYFSYGDAVILFSMMRSFRPNRIIEVGSGFSSAAMLDTNEHFFEGKVHITFIEPFPDRLQSLLKTEDPANVRQSVLPSPVQQVSLSVFEELEENDILFIDSSHVMKAGSDLNFLMFSVLPVLKPGVIIHFHDVIWPFEYPHKWFKNGRAWNEAYMLRAFLMHNSAYEILFFNSWLEEHHRPLLKRNLPLMLRRPSFKITRSNSSLWIRKK